MMDQQHQLTGDSDRHQINVNSPRIMGSLSMDQDPIMTSTLRSREVPNNGMETNSLLRVSVMMYRLAVVLVDLCVFTFKTLWELLKISFFYFFPVREKSIAGEVALVTGAGQGIGRELALELAKCGAIVVCVDVRTDTNEETMRMVQQMRGLAFAYTCDVSSREQVEDLQRAIKSEVGDVTILINNAGVLYCRPFLQHSARQIETVIQTNLMGKLKRSEAVGRVELVNIRLNRVNLSGIVIFRAQKGNCDTFQVRNCDF